MEYDEILQMSDKIFAEIVDASNLSAYTHGLVNNRLSISNGTPESAHVLAALRRLSEDGFLDKKDGSTESFHINGNTFNFKNSGAYKSLVEKENIKEKYREAIDELGLKSTQSVIDTNKSIQTLNTNTNKFYEKQTSFNRWQKGLTIAIGLFTLAQVLTAIFKKDSKTETIQIPSLKEVESKLNQLESKAEAKASRDSLFHRQVKDSLKMK